MPSRPTSANTPSELLRSAAERVDWTGLEMITHRDPAARGLASYRVAGRMLDEGAMSGAAMDIAQRAMAVGIVTGFCALGEKGVTAETDGPPGALFLARVLSALGVEVCLISDRYALPLLRVGCDLVGLDRNTIIEFPLESGDGNSQTDLWVSEFFDRGVGRRLSHLVAIERPGPSHTTDSFKRQSRRVEPPLERFALEVPSEHQNICHNMRGVSIEAFTAKIHRLFDWISEHKLPVTTIGIGDGGNEIGMGSFTWETLVEAIGSRPAGRIACRIPADLTLLAGISNWGAYGLGLAVAYLQGGAELVGRFPTSDERQMIERIVKETDAIDGITLRREPTVDGIALETYLEPLDAMHGLLKS